jgi:hypothetical protein
MPKPAVIIVGADKGGVGKTTVARTLLDYLIAHQIATRAFDTETPRGTLRRFHPSDTTVVDATQVADQIRIFDTLNAADSVVTVIDLRAGLLSPILKTLRDIGFFDVVKNGQITLALLHVLGPSITSLEEIGDTVGYLDNARYFMVKNFINDTHFFNWDEATSISYFKKSQGAEEIVIPKLNEMAAEQVDLFSVPYLTFIANKTSSGDKASYSFVLRGYVRNWLGKVWAEYDRVSLIDIVVPKRSASSLPRWTARG